MNGKDQLDQWVEGNPVHLGAKNGEGGQCCPDFSCCQPALLVPRAVREAFRNADDMTRNEMLEHFIAVGLDSLKINATVVSEGKGTEH